MRISYTKYHILYGKTEYPIFERGEVKVKTDHLNTACWEIFPGFEITKLCNPKKDVRRMHNKDWTIGIKVVKLED